MNYKPPRLFFNPHIETIAPAILRRVKHVPYQRERIETPDDDFLDLDWLKNSSEKLVIISHGLEGDSHKPYMRGMAKAFSDNGYDVLAWNYRGCSGEMNRQLRFYHSGATDDLNTVIKFAITQGYENINLVGFSLGGNITLKYLGENGINILPEIKKAVVFSVPMNLHSSCLKISEPDNIIYSKRFLRNLKSKVRLKAKQMPDMIKADNLHKINTLMAFDNAYTAPIHGFVDAIDYYTKCSSLYFLEDITTETLIVNALNDPFLAKDCFPIELLDGHKKVILETPTYGGHVGFTAYNKQKMYWSEQRAIAFINGKE
jgi:predicted alpha/beta-fold hydrolase